MVENYTLTELLAVLLNRVAERKEGGSRLLPQNPKVLHGAFFELRSRYMDAFPPLRQLHFITAGAFPYSPDLTEALDMLQFSGSISRENPSYEQFTLKQYPDTADWLDEETRRLIGGDEDRSTALNEMIVDLAQALS